MLYQIVYTSLARRQEGQDHTGLIHSGSWLGMSMSAQANACYQHVDACQRAPLQMICSDVGA